MMYHTKGYKCQHCDLVRINYIFMVILLESCAQLSYYMK